MKTMLLASPLLVLAILFASRSSGSTGASGFPGAPGVPHQGDDREALMQEKLGHAQKVLEHLSTNDLAAVATDAAAIAALTRDARWRISETPEYLSRSVEFERTATTLSTMASGKNGDGAALAWVQLTTQCFDCHRWLRDSRKAR